MGNLEAAKKKAECLQVHNERTWHNNPTWKEMMDVLAAYHYSPAPTPEPSEFKVGDQVMGTGDLVKGRLLQIKGERITKGGWWNMEDGSAWPEEWLRHATPEEIGQNEKPEFKPDQWVMVLPGALVSPGLYQISHQHSVRRERWVLKEANKGYSVDERFMRHSTDAEKYRPGAVVRYKDEDMEIEGGSFSGGT